MFRTWAKRLATLYSLLRSIHYRKKIERKGAVIGTLSLLGKSDFIGNYGLLHIGNDCVLGKVSIALHDAVNVGNRVVINDNVTLLTGNHDISDPEWGLTTKEINIGDYAWIAQGATILPGVSIGIGAVVGACAVVSQDVPDYTVVAGNPAKQLEKKRVNKLNYSPVNLLAPFNAWLAKDKLDTSLELQNSD
jgi:maltose O-acetyltransferase